MALRERTGTLDLESRPTNPSTTRDKKLNFLQRWTMNHHRRGNGMFTVGSISTTNSTTDHRIHSGSNDNSNNPNMDAPMRNNTTVMTPRSTGMVTRHSHHINYKHSSPLFHSHPKRYMTYSSPTTSNLFEWMQMECPGEILPRILAFAGPQTALTLSTTNHFWNNVMKNDATWRVLCEELYKWKEGDDVPTSSWRDFYKYNPCVPIDYSTVHAALSVVEVARNDVVVRPTSVRLQLRPGRYILREAITVQDNNDDNAAAANNTGVRPNNRPIAVEIVTQDHFPEVFFPTTAEAARRASSSPTEPAPSRKRKSSLRRIFQCRTVDVEETNQPDNEDMLDIDATAIGGIPPELLLENNPLGTTGLTSSPSFSSNSSSSTVSVPIVNRASLILRTRRHNEPLVRVRQGTCTIRNVDLRHNSYGTDIWNGNAAVQLQPPMGPDEQPLMILPAPTVNLDRVEITSASGRGIVNIDGGFINVTNCHVHDCAATGIYVGGPGSRARIERSDVTRNGNGNNQHRRGIARGHSGIYLEQGHASIIDCNVSQNSLTGISAVSPENAVLTLEESDLMSNGTYQLEMPAAGTIAHRNSNISNNNLSTTGLARSRSGLVVED